MKSIYDLRGEAEQCFKLLENHERKSKEFKKWKSRYDFILNCIYLVEAGLSQDTIDRKIKELKEQYGDIRLRFNKEFSKFDEEKKKFIKPSSKKFQSRTGAGKIRQQLKTYLYLK